MPRKAAGKPEGMGAATLEAENVTFRLFDFFGGRSLQHGVSAIKTRSSRGLLQFFAAIGHLGFQAGQDRAVHLADAAFG